MTHSIILENVLKVINLNEKEQGIFISKLESRKLKKKQFLIHEHSFCQISAFVNSGCLRSYIIDKNGVEHILSFAPKNWWITDLGAITSGKPSVLNIDAIDDSEVLILSKQAQEQLFEELPVFEKYFRILLERSMVAHQERIIDNISASAKDRFMKFSKKYPDLLHLLPQKQIASYIGVTPEFFSKMKKLIYSR